MDKRGLRLIDPPPARRRPPNERTFTLDTKCVRILRLFVTLHETYGKDAVIHAYSNPKDEKDGVGWFEVRGVYEEGRPKKFEVDWADTRRRTENMAHVGLLDWVNKNVVDEAGFRLNKNGYDFVNGLAVVRKHSVFKGGWIGVTRRKGPRVAINEITDTRGDRESTGIDG